MMTDESTNEEFFVDGDKERQTDIIKESFLMPKQGSGKLLKESYTKGRGELYRRERPWL